MTAYDDDGEVTVLSNFPNGEKIGPALVSGGRRRKCPRGRRRENCIGDSVTRSGDLLDFGQL